MTRHRLSSCLIVVIFRVLYDIKPSYSYFKYYKHVSFHLLSFDNVWLKKKFVRFNELIR